MNKVVLYIKQVFLLAISSKLRFVLIFLGTLVGVYIYAVGSIVLDSIYYSQTEEVRRIPERAFYVLAENNVDSLTKNMLSVTTKKPLVERISNTSHVVYEVEHDDVYKIISAVVHGVSKPSDNILVNSTEYGVNMASFELVEGRNFTMNEISNNAYVCIIDEYTAGLLFGEDEAVGKRVFFNKYTGGVWSDSEEANVEVAYEVVGVVKNTFYTEKEMEKDNNYIGIDNEQSYIFVNMFCPYNYYLNIGEDADGYSNIGYLWEYENETDTTTAKAIVQNHIDIATNQYDISQVIDKEYKYKLIEDKLKNYETAINIATIILFVIMGTSCMSIIFFAMKERVYEIGVKKAFGASVIDIVFQFWLENLLIIILSVVTAVTMSVVTVTYCEQYIVDNLYKHFRVYIEKKNIILPMLFGIAQGIIFTIIPCIRYSVINVVKALKLEK